MTAARCFTRVHSPVGPLLLVGTQTSLTGLYMQNSSHNVTPEPAWTEDSRPFAAVRGQLEAYFAGSLTEFDLNLEPAGTPFQQTVWSALQSIPYGTTTTYGALARSIGNSKAVRAVGAANGQNPISIVIPCHRVIGADRTLVGYGGGLEAKKALLELEGVSLAPTQQDLGLG